MAESVAETAAFSCTFSRTETATFAQVEFAADFIILGVTFGHGKFAAHIVKFSTGESVTESTDFGKFFTLADTVVFDHLFSPIYFEAETTIFGNMFSPGVYLLLPVCLALEGDDDKVGVNKLITLISDYHNSVEDEAT